MRPDRPAEREAVGRRRARRRRGAVGDLERGVRRHRRAPALGAVHAGQGKSRAARGLNLRVYRVQGALLPARAGYCMPSIAKMRNFAYLSPIFLFSL